MGQRIDAARSVSARLLAASVMKPWCGSSTSRITQKRRRHHGGEDEQAHELERRLGAVGSEPGADDGDAEEQLEDEHRRVGLERRLRAG